MGAEHLLSRKIVAALRKAGYHTQPIENAVASGAPDLYMCKNGKSLWVELKVFKWPERESSPVRIGLRTNQVMWAREHIKHGGTVLLLAKEVYSNELFLFDWNNMDTDALLNPFVLTHDELRQKAVAQGTIGNVLCKLHDYTKEETDGRVR